MFSRIQARNYRCFREVDVALTPFEVLVGANGSGKSALLDILTFLSDLMAQDLTKAVERRTKNFHDLVWRREGHTFSLMMEAALPDDKQGQGNDTIRYELEICLDAANEELLIARESAALFDSRIGFEKSHRLLLDRKKSSHRMIGEFPGSEQFQRDNLEPGRSSLNLIPLDSAFPAAAWLRDGIRREIRMVALNRSELGKASPPGIPNIRRISGLRLARYVLQLKSAPGGVFDEWLGHIRTALPDIRTVDSVFREEDKHRYVMVEYSSGIRVPAWGLSDGTLRFLALTILTYLPNFTGVYLIEEPENGVHPLALEAIHQSLSSVYDGQVLVASHSPVLISLTELDHLLCFSKSAAGEAQIVRGADHPILKNWKGEVPLSDLVASGILE